MQVVRPSVSLRFYLQVLHCRAPGNATSHCENTAQKNRSKDGFHRAIMQASLKSRAEVLRSRGPFGKVDALYRNTAVGDKRSSRPRFRLVGVP